MFSVKLVEVIQTERIDSSDPLKKSKKIVEFWTKDGELIARDEQNILNCDASMLNQVINK